MKAEIFIGTSGFYYKNWHKKFYPSDIKKENLLNYYSQYFRTVEINASFYRIPSAKTAEGWKKKVPDAFEFRHPSWFKNEIYELLKQFNVALVLADSPLKKSGQNVWPLANKNTADFFYIRLHGSKKLLKA
jgi:uncharacterized protein YecE (DUF72 family)